MAKVFKAEAALRKLRENYVDPQFEEAVRLINGDIQKACLTKRKIAVSSDDMRYRGNFFSSATVFRKVIQAFKKQGGYCISIGVCPEEPEYHVVVFEW